MWLGIVIRLDQESVDNIFERKWLDRRKVGRPWLRWLEDVENDL
jgi:hypothetical protein